MNNSWVETTIGTLVDKRAITIQTGPFGSQLHSSDYEPSGIPVIPTEAIGRRRLITDGVPRVSLATANRLSRHKLRPGDILFARRGVQATGLSALVEEEHSGWLCGTGAILLRVNDPAIDPSYLSFVLSTDSTIEWLKQHAVGAVMPNLNETVIRGLRIPLPLFMEQRAIADVLSSLDNKIELNQRMNSTFELMAWAVFRKWFVENQEVWNWEVGRLGDLVNLINERVDAGTKKDFEKYIALDDMPSRSIDLSKHRLGLEVNSSITRFKKGDILFGSMRPYFHKVGVAPYDGITRTTTFTLRPKQNEFLAFALYWFFSDEVIDFSTTASVGTTIPYIHWKTLEKYEIPVPPIAFIKKFNDFFQPIWLKIVANSEESRTLASLRDSLLPKLMRGEVRVSEL